MLLVLPAGRAVGSVDVELMFHVKRMFVALAPVPVMASRPQTSLDSMNRRCLYMRFYDAKMGLYEL